MRIGIFSVILGFIPLLFSQTIENVDFYLENQRIVVRYDLIYPKPDTLFNISLVFRNDKGAKITPISLSGDLNKVKPGVGKHIYWDALKDQAVLSGKYKAELSIEQIKTIQIGSQVWMVENLNVDRFRNGDLIPEAGSKAAWKKAGKNKQPVWCYYDNDPNNGASYGKLYNWYAVNDSRGLAPKGYHVPSDAEWTVLTNYLGGENVAGKRLKSTTGWNDQGNGTNSSGFSGLPGGNRYDDGLFLYIGEYGYWWSSTEDGTVTAWYRNLAYNDGKANRFSYDKGEGFSVRCLRDY